MPARLRRQQITALLLHRHGGPCLTDDAEAWFDEIAPHLILSCSERALYLVAEEWAAKYTPSISKAYVSDTLEQMRRKMPFYTSKDIGRRLNVKAVEKDTLQLRHIAASDLTPRQANNRKKAKNRDRMRKKRLKKGMRPQSQSKARMKPWEKLNISRTTFYRMGLHADPAAP